MTERMLRILKKNAEMEKHTPYNFCDRWCERCLAKVQKRCALFLDELEKHITNIAHGKDPDDVEMLRNELRHRFRDIEDPIQPCDSTDACDVNDYCDDVDGKLKFRKDELQDHCLLKVATQYSRMSHSFLTKYFRERENISADMHYDYETLSWYHVILSAKIYRALCDIFIDEEHDDLSLCDAVAQMAICKKSINLSRKALRNLTKKDPGLEKETRTLLALLHNIFSQVEILESDI